VPHPWRGRDDVSAHLADKEEVSSSKRPCARRREDTARTSSGALEPRHLLVVVGARALVVAGAGHP
jgi:hypothetical protein